MQSFQTIKEPMLKELGQKFSETTMDLWFNKLEIAALSDKTVVIISDSDIKADIINKRYLDVLEEVFESILGFHVEVVTISAENRVIDAEKLQRDVQMGMPVKPFSLADSMNTQTTGNAVSEPSQNNTPSQEKKTVTDEKKESNTSAASKVTPAAPASQVEKKENDTALGQSINKQDDAFNDSFINAEYTFENFIVGSSNKFAHAACTAVANNPANKYNPLFIYGPSGLGKTHLLYAITNRVKMNNPSARVVYVKGEAFTNQLIEAISHEDTARFREKYRQADIFLIDDVQFIAGKVSTQEEFFNTFNELYEARKQIILTSDRPPKEMKTLEDRIKTRFEWGLIVDIQPPDLELRIAILRRKAEYMGVNIPIEVLDFLADKLKSNIRQIEGAINKLGAFSNLTQQPITVEMAEENLKDLLTGPEPVKITVDKIFRAVANKYGVAESDILGARRTKDIAMARHVCIYIMRNVTDMSLPSIGRVFNRDHTTILSSIKTIDKEIKANASVENDIETLIKEIRNT